MFMFSTMGRLMRFLKTIRNNWKKSTFAAAAIAYGVNYAKTSYETKQLMREYCLLAAKYGEVIHQPTSKSLRHVTVILNPAADKRKAKNLFEKYCAPLFHLAGLAVTVVTTEHAGQARDILSSLSSQTDAIVVAGGDGTLSETVTGLLRRAKDDSEALKSLPLAALPLGRTNSVSSVLVGNKERVRSLADATMSVVDGIVAPVDLIKVEPTDDEKESKPVYGLAKIEWGPFRDARVKRDKYWYFGGLREYVSVLFSEPREGSWRCSYVEPCSGCSACAKSVRTQTRWWHSFVPGRTGPPSVDYSKVSNSNCGRILQEEFSSVELDVETCTISTDADEYSEAPRFYLKVGPPALSRLAFVSEGWRRLSGGEKIKPVREIAVRELRLDYLNKSGSDSWFSIDSEEFEVKPVKITVLPKMLNLFRPRVNGYVS